MSLGHWTFNSLKEIVGAVSEINRAEWRVLESF